MQAAVALTGRQFGLDWLRIGAFGLLIVYHIGMFFVPWGWHVKTSEPIDWAVWPMMAINPWRLMLLFVISGVVSRALITKLARPRRFAARRSSRLLLPLLAGMVIFVAPQPWFELRDRCTYDGGLLYFWLNDYFEFGGSRGTPLPTWNHLWFVAYLWVYTMGLAIIAALPVELRSKMQRGFDMLFSGWRLIVLPIVWLTIVRYALHPAFGETHALVDDPYAHAVYSFSFFFGVALARSNTAWTGILGAWKHLLLIAVLACLAMFAIHAQGNGSALIEAARIAARATLAWCAILGLLGFAQSHLHRDSQARRYLTEAIFPFYIVHQTIIIAVGFWLKQTGIAALSQFAIILFATLAGCILTYELGRRVGWLRPFLGLKRKEPIQKKREDDADTGHWKIKASTPS